MLGSLSCGILPDDLPDLGNPGKTAWAAAGCVGNFTNAPTPTDPEGLANVVYVSKTAGWSGAQYVAFGGSPTLQAPGVGHAVKSGNFQCAGTRTGVRCSNLATAAWFEVSGTTATTSSGRRWSYVSFPLPGVASPTSQRSTSTASAVDCSNAGKEGTRLGDIGQKAFAGYDTWYNAPNFEQVMKPKILQVRSACGSNFAVSVVEQMNVVGTTWRALFGWAQNGA